MSNLVVPIYSMRSYKTGKYSILKDGNFKLHINRMNWKKDLLVVPDKCSDLEEFKSLNIIPKENIVKAQYGKNAYETRKSFWENNEQLSDYGLTIVTDMPRYKGPCKSINNFNITKDPKNPRWYIDEFINDDVEQVKIAEKTYVLNETQKKYLVSQGAPKDKIIVSTKVISKKYFDVVGTCLPNDLPEFDIFFPFRISDPAYQFDDIVETNQEKIILITDPNESYKGFYKNIVKKRFTKREYYGILELRPKVYYYENPEKIFHPGLADFIYFNCDITSIWNIPTLKDVLIEDENYFY